MSQYPIVEQVLVETKQLIKNYRYPIGIRTVCQQLSIFDWWNDTLSLTQLKQMASFLEFAYKIGFRGYCCFKVGASGCANGMWAYREVSTDGYSPRDTSYLYRSFTPDYTEWVLEDGDTHIETSSLNELKKKIREA